MLGVVLDYSVVVAWTLGEFTRMRLAVFSS